MSRPNVILITTDQQRYDALSCNGHPLLRTPHIDALAADGTAFSQAFVASPVCVPSRACLQTGRYTHQHGVTYMESVVDSTPGLPPAEITFMERLQAAGYRTAAAGKLHMYPAKGFDDTALTGGKGARWTRATGLSIGPGPLGPTYASWLEARHPGAYESIYASRRAQQPRYSHTGLHETPLPSEEYVEHWIADEAIRFVESHAPDARPFFLWCGFCGPHDPWDPPEPYRSMYSLADVTLPAEYPGWPSWRDRWDEATMRQMRAYYLGMMTCIDDEVGRLVAALKAHGLYDEALVVFTADHGEFMGERGRTGKGLFYDSITHAPLLVKAPASSGYPHRIVQDLVQNASLAPTVLDFAGVPIPEAMSVPSLRPLMAGRGGGALAVFAEHVDNNKANAGKCVRTRSHKYMLWEPGHREELYDLLDDPAETVNRADDPAYAAVRWELQSELLAWLTRTEWRWSYRW